jgi:hypothetical protein
MSAWGFKAGVRKLGARRGGAAESEVEGSCGGGAARTPAECESAASARDTGARVVIPGGSACKRLLSDSDSSDELEDLTEDTGAPGAAAEGAVGANGKGKAEEDQTEDMGGARGAAEKGAAVAKGKGTVPKARKRARKVITIEDGDDVEALSDRKKRQGLGWEVLDVYSENSRLTSHFY